MNESTLLIYAGIVFALMVTGIVLTALEFKYGAPKKQEEEHAGPGSEEVATANRRVKIAGGRNAA